MRAALLLVQDVLRAPGFLTQEKEIEGKKSRWAAIGLRMVVWMCRQKRLAWSESPRFVRQQEHGQACGRSKVLGG
jgi:hypothetical protein